MIERTPKIIENFHSILSDHTAGDPMRKDVKWTNLSRQKIAKSLEALGTPAGKILRHVRSMQMVIAVVDLRKSGPWNSTLILMRSLKISPT